jgi:hypothetical protein
MEIYQAPMIIPVIIIYLLAFLERTVLDLGPNVELVTLAMLASGIYLSRNTSLKLTFLLMAATDLILGNTRIFLFTWSGFLLPIFILSKLSTMNYKLSILKITGLGLISNLFFYIWTNFGVWALDTWGMYPKTLPGLIDCYLMGLPFLKLQLQSTLVFVPIGMTSIYVIRKLGSGRYLLKALRLI